VDRVKSTQLSLEPCAQAMDDVEWPLVLGACQRLRRFKLNSHDQVSAGPRLLAALADCSPRLRSMKLHVDELLPGALLPLARLKHLHKLKISARTGGMADEWSAILPDCHFLRVIFASQMLVARDSLFPLCEALGITFVQPF
jgi:hypothetical protein